MNLINRSGNDYGRIGCLPLRKKFYKLTEDYGRVVTVSRTGILMNFFEFLREEMEYHERY